MPEMTPPITTADVMAVVKYRFHSRPSSYLIEGETRFDSFEHAKRIAETLCEIYGKGTHWAEPLNYTRTEFDENRKHDIA